MSSAARTRRADVAWILVVAFAFAMLLPIAVTTYLGDDTFNSYINGALGYAHTPFWTFIGDLECSWIRRGRFFPGALIESYGLFHIMPSLAAYKAFQIAITLANVATFYLVLRTLRVPRAFGLLATLGVVCAFQMRDYHDGLLGFSGNIEFIMELALLSTLGLLLHARQKRPWLLAASLGLYAVGLLTYEVSYLLWLAFFAALLAEHPWRRALRLVLPYVALSAIVVAIQLYVKATAHAAPDADYSVRLDAAALLGALGKQWIAALPLTYPAFDPSHMFAHGRAVLMAVPFWVDAAIFLIAATAAMLLAGSLAAEPIAPRALAALAAMGAIFWLTPAVLVAASARYQRELLWGLGHVPVYIEYYGVALIALALLGWAVHRWGPPPATACAALGVLVGTVATFTYATNSIVIARSTNDQIGLRNMEAALHAGLLHGVPSGAELYVDASIAPNRYLDESATDAKYFYFYETRTAFDVHSIGALIGRRHCAAGCTVAQPAYELVNVPAGENAGFTALGRIAAVATERGQVRSFAPDVRLYIRGAPTDAPLAIRYTRHGCGADRSVTQILPPPRQPSESVRLRSACGAIEMDGLAVAQAPAVQ